MFVIDREVRRWLIVFFTHRKEQWRVSEKIVQR